MNRSGWNGKLAIDHENYEFQGKECVVKLEAQVAIEVWG